MTECWPFFAQVTQKSVLCLRVSHQKCLKNKTERWPFLVPLLCSSAFTLSENNRKIYQKSDQKSVQMEAWGGPGGSWGRPGSHFGPKAAQSSKNLEKVTWRTPPREPSWEPKLETKATRMHFLSFF